MVNYPEARYRRGYNFNDYAELPFTATQQTYVIGVAAFASNPLLVPGIPAELIGVAGITNAFEAHEIEFFTADVDCWVRFNSPTAVPHRIRANTPTVYHQRVYIIYYVRVTTNGTLCIRSEG